MIDTTDYAKFIKAEEELKQHERESGLFMLDTYKSKPGMRHLANELHGGWMRTLCGHKVINYHLTGLTSCYYSDGSVYVNLCPSCFPEQELPL